MHNVLFKDNQLESFFSSLDKKKRYLLAFSGGPDSTFLFHVLLTYQISFVAAYVNHGWREEASSEARQLQELCESYQVSFRCHVVDRSCWGKGDLENTAREIRYSFFEKLCNEEGLSGVFVGHHVDDKAETILKRVLEGAGLASLSGPKEFSQKGTVRIIRPLLHMSKQEIENKLREAKIPYFLDKTNAENRFLRSRMRKSIIPYLQQQFGKNITKPLLALAKDSDEIAEYIDQESSAYLKEVSRSNVEVTLTLPESLLQKPFLAKQVIKKFFLLEGIGISRHTVSTIYYHMVQRSRHVVIRVHRAQVDINERTIRIC